MTEEKATKKEKKTKAAQDKSDFSVIATGGKQYIVRAGDEIFIEKIEGKEGDTVTFDSVLLRHSGGEIFVGTPFVDAAQVTATVVEQGRAKKLHVIRFRAKSRYFRKYGHRQPFTRVRIESV